MNYIRRSLGVMVAAPFTVRQVMRIGVSPRDPYALSVGNVSWYYATISSGIITWCGNSRVLGGRHAGNVWEAI